VDRVSTIKTCHSEWECESAAMQEFHRVVELSSTRQTSGNEYKFFR
jgi:hypothetical protein